MNARDRRRDLFGGRIGIGQVGANNEGDLGLGLRLDRPCRVEASAIGDAHVVEQDAEVGLVDAELRLHRLRGQPRLAPDNPPALRFPEARVDRLHRISARGIGRIQRIAQRRDNPARIGIAQATGDGFVGCRHRALPGWTAPQWPQVRSSSLA